MKKLVIILLLAAIAAAVLVQLNRRSEPTVQTIEGLPWQIEPQPDGSALVFGFRLGEGDLGKGLDHFGMDRELALIIGPGEQATLEAFYTRYKAGFLTGKLVLVAAIPMDMALEMRARGSNPKILDSGAQKFHLSRDDMPAALQLAITSITFIPSAQLDADIVEQRFGPADDIIATAPTLTHYLYPALGLDLIMDSEGKEILQYVPPREFSAIAAPLEPMPVTDTPGTP